MEERYLHSVGPRARLLVDQANAVIGKTLKLAADSVGAQGDMMQPGPAFGEKIGNGRIVGGWLEKLYARETHLEKGDAHLLVGNLFDSTKNQT